MTVSDAVDAVDAADGAGAGGDEPAIEPAIERARLTPGGLTFDGLLAGPDDGEPVVLLHGFPETSACWRPQLAALAAAGFRALAPDQRGYSVGARPAGDASYRVGYLAADVLGLADLLGMERFHVVGHDWGGVVAWALAADHPERLRTAVVVSTPHPRAIAAVLPRSDQLVRSSYIGFFRLPVVSEAALLAANGFLLRQLLRRTGLSAGWADDYVRFMQGPGALTAALRWYRANGPSLPREVGRAAVPTLYVWGSHDVPLGREAAEATARFVEAPYRFVELPGVSHWVPEERPEELSGLLLDHLAVRR